MVTENLNADPCERYFRQLFEAGWVGVETLLTKSQIENAVSFDFISGLFVATIIACIEDDHLSDDLDITATREVLYKNLGGLQGVIGELIRRMEFDWQYAPMDQRTAADWESPDLHRVRMR